TLTNSTVSDNAALATQNPAGSNGGGIISSGPVTLQSSIVAGNTSLLGHPDMLAPSPTLSHSLLGNNDGTGLTATGFDASGNPIPDANGNLIGSVSHLVVPKFGPLQDNGGPTPTVALPPDSPAIHPRAHPPPPPTPP